MSGLLTARALLEGFGSRTALVAVFPVGVIRMRARMASLKARSQRLASSARSPPGPRRDIAHRRSARCRRETLRVGVRVSRRSLTAAPRAP